MEPVFEVINTTQIANIAEGIIQNELKELQNSEKRRRLLGARCDHDPTTCERLMPGGLFTCSSSIGIPPGMTVILQTSHVFLRKAGAEFVEIRFIAFFDLPNRFELLDTAGTRILFAAETYEDFGDGNDCLGAGSVTFDLSLLGVHGGGVLCIKSNKAGVVTISDFRKMLGTILDIGGFCCYTNHRSYAIRDSNNCEIFKIRATKTNINMETDFEIFDKDLNKIGYYSKNWSSTNFPEHADIDDILFGVQFPQNMDPNEKILLVGGLFTIYFQHVHEGGHISSRRGLCILLTIISISVVIIVLLIILIVLLIRHSIL